MQKETLQLCMWVFILFCSGTWCYLYDTVIAKLNKDDGELLTWKENNFYILSDKQRQSLWNGHKQVLWPQRCADTLGGRRKHSHWRTETRSSPDRVVQTRMGPILLGRTCEGTFTRHICHQFRFQEISTCLVLQISVYCESKEKPIIPNTVRKTKILITF